MDIYSLAATNLRNVAQPARMNAKAENHYYSKQVGLPRLSLALLGSIATTASVILIMGIVLI